MLDNIFTKHIFWGLYVPLPKNAQVIWVSSYNYLWERLYEKAQASKWFVVKYKFCSFFEITDSHIKMSKYIITKSGVWFGILKYQMAIQWWFLQKKPKKLSYFFLNMPWLSKTKWKGHILTLFVMLCNGFEITTETFVIPLGKGRLCK